MIRERIEVECDGARVRLAVIRRGGRKPPVVFFHGFGSTKEDYSDLALYPAFDGRAMIAFDAPGSGETEDSRADLTVSRIAAAADALLRHCGISSCHLVGHSMGGLAALLYARDRPATVRSFINIEGNLAPEDCFLSRQVFDFPAAEPAGFLEAFRMRLRNQPRFSAALHAAGLDAKVRAETVDSLFRSLVRASDEDDLLGKFLALSCPKMFMYGAENRSLSYLHLLAEGAVQLREIPWSGHFPMYSNPPEMWQAIATFVDGVDGGAVA